MRLILAIAGISIALLPIGALAMIVPPPPSEQAVTFTAGDHTLAGTLSLPYDYADDPQPRPAIILISGSGPSDRDESLPGIPMKPFARMLDLLGNYAILLRFDDRGVGGSTGDFASATTADFADDVEAAIGYLLSRPEVDRARIGLLGHSEGGMVAAMVAARNDDVAFVISLAGVAVSGYELLSGQLRDTIAASIPEDQRQAAYDAEIASLDEVVAQDWAAVEARLRAQYAALPDEAKPQVGSENEYLAGGLTYMKGWLHVFATYDPAADWRRVDVPVLGLFGDLDRQVSADQNAPALAAALAGNPKATIIRLPTANHLFQTAVTGGMDEYATLEPNFSEQLYATLRDWFMANVGR